MIKDPVSIHIYLKSKRRRWLYMRGSFNGSAVSCAEASEVPESVEAARPSTSFCVEAVGAFSLLNSLLAGAVVFIGGYIFGRWITTTDPAFLKIMGKSERFKLRYEIEIY
jgi:hypothetical protein